MKLAVIIPVAGIGKRMQAQQPKQYLSLQGKPMICHTLECFRRFEQVIITVEPERVQSFRSDILVPYHFPEWIVLEGGEKRQDSVSNGFASVSLETDVVLVHDGVRPFITQDVIDQTVSQAAEHGAAIVAVPVSDTVKKVDDKKCIERTLERTQLFRAQTPQAARYELLKEAFERARQDRFYGTDEASLIERLGKKVVIVPGNERNIKITTPEDLKFAEFLLRQ